MCKSYNKTFSFLPDFLIPYRLYSIGFIFKILVIVKNINENEESRNCGNSRQSKSQQILNEISKLKGEVFEKLEYSHIKNFIKCVDTARERFILFSKKIINNAFTFIDKCILFSWENKSGPLAIKAFILQDAGYFLFGNASQHRRSFP
jgi:hypothetical protein